MEIVNVDSGSLDELVSSVTGLFREDAGARDEEMDTGWPAREGHAYYTDMLGKPDTLLLLARRGDACVGHLVGRLRVNNPLRPNAVVGELESMRVAADARRQGVGAALASEFFAWARGCAATEFRVTAYAANYAALGFYARLGFTDFLCTLRAR